MGRKAGIEGFIAAQVEVLRSKSIELARYGAHGPAEALLRAASDLETSFQTYWLAELTVAEAAAEAGYSEERIREMLREGRLDGDRAGRTGPFRLRRCDLPRKARARETQSLSYVAERLGIV